MEPSVELDKRKGMIAMIAVGEALGLAHDDRGAEGFVRTPPPAAWPAFREAAAGSTAFRAFWAADAARLEDVAGVPGPITAALLDPRRAAELPAIVREMLQSIERGIAGAGSPRLSLLSAIRSSVRHTRELTRDALALFGVILSEAYASVGGTKHVHYWFSETVRKRLPEWFAAEPGLFLPSALDSWRAEWQNMVTLAINLRGRSIDAFLAAMRADHATRRAEGIGGADDPALLILFAAAHLTFTSAGFTNALRIAGSGPGRTSLLGALTGAWVGAYYGFARLAAFDTPEEPIVALLQIADAGAKAALGIDFDGAAARLFGR